MKGSNHLLARTLIIFIGVLTASVGITGCNKKQQLPVYKEIKQYRPVVTYLYVGETKPIEKVSEDYLNQITVSQEDINKIPSKEGERDLSTEDREYYAKVSKEVADVGTVIDKYILTMYSLNPDNVKEQCKILEELSFEQIRPQYESVINEITQQQIQRKYLGYTLDKASSIDIKILSNKEVHPGKIIGCIVSYEDKLGNKVQDNIELRIININNQWEIVQFKVNK